MDVNFQNSNTNDKLILRCYGILESDIRTLLSNYFSNNYVSIDIISYGLDNKILIRYNSTNYNTARIIIAEICSKLSKFTYATEDTNLYQTAINLLSIQNKKVVIGETLTHGNLTYNLSIFNKDIIEYSYIFNNFNSIILNLNIDSKIIDQFGKYSVNTIYELNNLLLQKSTSDIAIFILGDKTEELCYIAIGDIDGIHVYKNGGCRNAP